MCAVPASVLLVHGAWGGPWGWDRVVAGLEAEGVAVRATELHRGTLAADTAAVQADVGEMSVATPVVVCGHSYGGAVITGLEPRGIAHLVYLAAFMPDTGESVRALTAGRATPELVAAQVRGSDRTLLVRPELARAAFYADCEEEEAQRAVARLRPQALEPFLGAPERAVWRSVESTYVVCSEDKAIDPGLQRELAVRATHTVTWPTAHSPYLCRPQLVVDLLAGLAHTA